MTIETRGVVWEGPQAIRDTRLSRVLAWPCAGLLWSQLHDFISIPQELTAWCGKVPPDRLLGV